ncbi:MAG: glycosyltransferase family 87 protein [Terracidiphilus sp.]
MTRTQRIALVYLLLSCGVSVLLGFCVECTKPDAMLDFKGVYYDTRCLLQHDDPYRAGEPLRVYQAAGGVLPQVGEGLRQNLTWNVYLPATSIFIAPLAMLPWAPAHVLWMIFTAASLVFAGFLMWNIGANYSPLISGALICFILANSEVLFATGNTAGIVVGLCVVAVWCFLRERFVWAGILCLAVSLAIKPHDAGLVWLFFLLAGGIYRKRALQTLVLIAVLMVPACLWVSSVAPHWMGELHSNLLAASAPGGNSDPGPANPIYKSCPAMIIDLQSTISAFRDDPRIYNSISYLVCGALLLIWSFRTLRTPFSQRKAWLALAAIVPLTLLVSYHRPYDTKLLLLTVPACAMLWAEGGTIRWPALLVTTAGFVLTADVPLIILMIFTKNLPIYTPGLSGQILTAVLTRPTPLILLAMAIFYLWIYMRRAPERGLP